VSLGHRDRVRAGHRHGAPDRASGDSGARRRRCDGSLVDLAATTSGTTMSLWFWVLVAAAAAYAIKLSGYLLPRKLLDRPVVVRLATGLTVGLLASLTLLGLVVRMTKRTPGVSAERSAPTT